MRVQAILFLVLFDLGIIAQQVPDAGQMQKQLREADALYEKHDYAGAARIYEQVSSDPQARQAQWFPDALYNEACYEAMAGDKVRAVASLTSAVDLGYRGGGASIAKDSDLASLHDDPRFAALILTADRKKARWDSIALATPYAASIPEDQRIAGLSKFWSEARFNFPFFERVPDLDWDKIYVEYLPRVRAAQTTADYYRVLTRFAAELHDGHTNVYPPDEIADGFYSRPAVRTALIEDKVLVVSVLDPALEQQDIRPGLELLSIDGTPVRQYAEEEIAPYVSASTTQDRIVRTYNYLLLSGSDQMPVRLTFRSEKGREFERMLPRLSSKERAKLGRQPNTEFRLLPGDIAYFAINEFEDDESVKQFKQHLAELDRSQGLIIDLRANGGGNSAFGDQFLSMLTDKPFATLPWRTLNYISSYRAWGAIPAWHEEASKNVSSGTGLVYDKGVVLLTSSRTFSAAEDFVATFDVMHRGSIIGEPTGGSTGQPLSFKLPGGGSARICTKDDSYPDGRTFEGKGIMPQIIVRPSIADIRNNRDAVLEKAVKFLSQASSETR